MFSLIGAIYLFLLKEFKKMYNSLIVTKTKIASQRQAPVFYLLRMIFQNIESL